MGGNPAADVGMPCASLLAGGQSWGQSAAPRPVSRRARTLASRRGLAGADDLDAADVDTAGAGHVADGKTEGLHVGVDRRGDVLHVPGVGGVERIGVSGLHAFSVGSRVDGASRPAGSGSASTCYGRGGRLPTGGHSAEERHHRLRASTYSNRKRRPASPFTGGRTALPTFVGPSPTCVGGPLAVAAGFEPAVDLRPQTLSRRSP